MRPAAAGRNARKGVRDATNAREENPLKITDDTFDLIACAAITAALVYVWATILGAA